MTIHKYLSQKSSPKEVCTRKYGIKQSFVLKDEIMSEKCMIRFFYIFLGVGAI